MTSVGLVALLAASGNQMYGLSQESALVSIDTSTGLMSELTPEHPEELEAQELSAIDSNRQRYYSMGVNRTGDVVNLCVWSLKSGHREQQIPVPFTSSLFVGVGEALAVDPVDGTIVLVGHDPTHDGHHTVYKMDPESFAMTFVADLGGDMHTDLLGGSTAYDHDQKVLYVPSAFNDSTPQPAIKYSAVHLTSGTVESVDLSLLMAGTAYDSQTKRVFGTKVYSAEGEPLLPSAAVVPRERWAPSGRRTLGAPRAAARTLSYFETATREHLVSVAALPLLTAVGDVHAVDRAARVHYTLLLGEPEGKPFLPTDYCAKVGEPCESGSSCCCDSSAPAAAVGALPMAPPTCAHADGYCFSVQNCSEVPPSGDPLAVPAYIVGVHLDDGTATVETPLCSMEPSKTTVPAFCPWSIEVD